MNEKDVINELLMFTLKRFSLKLGLINEDIEAFPDEKAIFLLNIAEKYSRNVLQIATDERNDYILKCLYISGLLLENKKDSWINIEQFVTRILIRIGLNPSALMVGGIKGEPKFKGFDSLISEYYSALTLNSYKVEVCNTKKLILSDFQMRLWEAISENSRLGISAPTSAGKSFIIANRVIDIISRQKKAVIVYIVPTLSLIHQVSLDFKKLIKLFVLDINVYENINDENIKNDRVIYVLTQEWFSSTINNEKIKIPEIEYFIIDEIQNIEKLSIDSDERSKILYDVLMHTVEFLKPKHIIISGPRIENISEVVSNWFGENAKSISENVPPLLNLTYAFRPSPSRGKIFFEQFVNDKFGGNQKIEIPDFCDLKNKGFVGTIRKDAVINVINDLNEKFSSENGTIIFAGNSNSANNLAVSLAEKTKIIIPSNDKIDSFIEYISKSVHSKYNLIQSINKGILYHHGKVPHHIRIIIEHIFRNKDEFEPIKTIVSTSTLLQGVNIPAQNLIINDPNMTKDIKLSGYDFANLRGRAGRIMQDFIGRAIIINFDNFEDNIFENKNLILQPEKSFSSRYRSNQPELEHYLERGIAPKPNLKNGDLLTYIRQTVKKYGKQAKERFIKIGLSIDDKLFAEIKRSTDKITVPIAILRQNQYWDPIDLDNLFQTIDNYPDYDFHNLDKFEDILKKISPDFPYYQNRYLKPIIKDGVFNNSICISYSTNISNLLNNTPLSQIINYNISKPQDIDSNIYRLYKDVMFNIPKLLKPLISIKNYKSGKENPILSFIEYGTNNENIKNMIETGVPREVALNIYEFAKRRYSYDANNIKELKEVSRKISLNDWEKLIIDEL